MEAIGLRCKRLGWGWDEDKDGDGDVGMIPMTFGWRWS